jgi:hypothetical protein
VAPRHRHHEQRRHQHIAGHRDAVSIGECRGAAEAEHQGQHRGGEQPVNGGEIDLPYRVLGGLAHLQTRHGTELDGLLH